MNVCVWEGGGGREGGRRGREGAEKGGTDDCRVIRG